MDFNAIDFVSMFGKNTKVVLLDPFDEVLYSSEPRKCAAWLMKNSQYDIYPQSGGIWADVDNNKLIIYLDADVD